MQEADDEPDSQFAGLSEKNSEQYFRARQAVDIYK